MTSTVERRPLSRAADRAAPKTFSEVMTSGAVATGWALGAGLVAFAVPVLLIWAADRRSGAGAGEASRIAGQLWLLAHGTTLRLPDGVVGLFPLGLLALPLALLHRAGRHSCRELKVRTQRQAAQLVGAIAVPYALVATGLTALLTTEDVQPVAVRALLATLLVAVVGSGSGVLRDSGLLGRGVRFFPERIRALTRAGLTAVAALLVLGCAVVIVSLLMHLTRVTSLAGATGPGVVGGASLVLLQLALLPNIATWGVSWLAGPGFSIGIGTSVSPWAVQIGNVPALPVLGALPGSAAPTWVAVVALLLPVAVGVGAGLMVVRRLGDGDLRGCSWDAVGIGLVCGAVMAAVAWLSGGPLGSERLASVGPSAWQVGLALCGEVTVGAFVALAGSAWLSSRRS